MSFGVLLKIETQQTLIKEKICLTKNVPLLDREPFYRNQFPHSFFIVLSSPFAGLFEGRETAVVKTSQRITKFDKFLEVLQTKIELLQQ